MYIKKSYFMQNEHKAVKVFKEEGENNKEENRLQMRRELRNKGRESLDVSPQARDQSKREPLKEASS